MDPHELLDQVNDRDSFFEFVRALIGDRKEEVAKERISPGSPHGSVANGWENGTIEGYLDAALRWAESTDMGRTQGVPGSPSSRSFAVFLYCGKVYE